ncbi:MAG: hypothetical protein EOO10_16930 [Chitinophagaceae bacterium]|nr:MAG: hypothetical protein EOO10_16930 [Chitinophagaceae bacterium]
MKIIFLLLTTLVFTVAAMAQDRWTVQLNSKTLLTANEESTTKNVVKSGDLKKGSLIVTYYPGKVENERKRRIMIFDNNDQELYSKEAHSIVVPVANVKKWRLTSPQISVYTIPVLGEEGANVRLRRVHLATINLE